MVGEMERSGDNGGVRKRIEVGLGVGHGERQVSCGLVGKSLASSGMVMLDSWKSLSG